MARLTKSHRDTVRVKLLEHAFRERQDALEAESLVLGRAFYNLMYPEPVREKMAALGHGFFEHSETLTVAPHGFSSTQWLPIGERLPFAPDAYRKPQLFDDGKEPLLEKYRVWVQTKKGLRQERDRMSEEIRRALSALTTTKKLLDAWPEAAAYLPQDAAPVPAVIVNRDKLNKALRLP